MRWWWIVLAAAGLAAETPAPGDLVRGVLLERDQGASGDLSVRVKDNHVYCFRFDDKTQIERNGGQAGMADLRPGDEVEVLPQTEPGVRLRYARQVRVVVDPAAVPVARRRVRRETVDPLDELFPRGDLTMAGIVVRINPEALVLKTRTRGETRIVLRPDTRYVRDGVQVAATVLRINARVFVRASRTLENDIEAHQVMWGQIVNPAAVP